MTSVSNRPKSIKRRGNSKRSATSRSLRRNKTNSIAPAGAATATAASSSNQHQELPLEGRPGPTLRKRRSDDVRNWMNNSSNSNGKQTPVLNRAASTSSRRRKPMIQKLSTADLYQQAPLNNYYYNNSQYYYNPNSQFNPSTSPEIIQHMNFFQDVITVCDDEICPYEHHQHQCNVQQDDNKLRYHTSVRGKKLVQVNQGEESMPAVVAVSGHSECNDEGDNPSVQLKIEEKQQQPLQQVYTEQGDQDELGGEVGLLSSPNQDNINIVKRPTTIARRASMPLTDDNLLMQQQYQQQ
ncbi:hypothetical protein G6F42_025825 [Rhizopus arrhizus]|nr:hypothetical protein G6F42_025825 [Rhizopus arrhizus]